MNKKLSNTTRWFLPALLVVFFTTSVEAQVMTNRTPDKAKIQPETKKQPTSTQNSTIFSHLILGLVPRANPGPQDPNLKRPSLITSG
jgi:hypothetical protein